MLGILPLFLTRQLPLSMFGVPPRNSHKSPSFPTVLFVLSFVALLITAVGCGYESRETPGEETLEASDKHVLLNIGITDRTDRRPPSSQWSLKVPGHDLWQPDLSYGGESKDFGTFPVGEDHEMYVYPSGPDGPRLEVPFTMKSDMMSGLASSKTYIEIRDDRIIITTPAVQNGRVDLDRTSSETDS